MLCLTGAAEPIVSNHGTNFSTANRKIVISATYNEDAEQLEEMLALHGAKIMRGFFAKIIYPTVSFKNVASIYGSNEAFTIDVKKSSIKILYTSPAMHDKALKAFGELFDTPYGQRIVKGCYVKEVLAPSSKRAPSSPRRAPSGLIDGVTTLLSFAQIQNAAKHSNGSNFTVAIVSKRIFRFDFKAFDGCNSHIGRIANQGAYSSAQIAQFIKYIEEKGLDFVPAIDLLSDNEPFENFIGHKMNSVEGMRFVRSIIEQCAREWKVKKICIGRKDIEIDGRYIEFLNKIAANENVELIIL